MPERLRGSLGALGMLAVATMLPGAAHAQLGSCRLPATLPLPKLSQPSQAQPRRVMPIRSYTLALSWSPEYCARGSDAGSFQCNQRGNNRFGFVLHGLWRGVFLTTGREMWFAAFSILPTVSLLASVLAAKAWGHAGFASLFVLSSGA